MTTLLPLGRIAHLLLLAVVASVLAACATPVDGDVLDEPYVGHGEASDFAPVADPKADGVMHTFVQNLVLSDNFFLDAALMDATGIQAFLEGSPYGARSWLADETVEGVSFAQVLAQVCQDGGINPLLLLARLQVEASLVSLAVRPAQRLIDRAAGCGCFDGEACQRQYRGLDRQLRCAAQSLRRRLEDSRAGTGEWAKGRTATTLDRIRIRPENHATAALYAYTPWVLRGQGGTWLVWNVTKRYEQHALANGMTGHTATMDPFIGTPCTDNGGCDFVAGDQQAFCLQLDGQASGFCSVPCEGYCPDNAYYAGTFCAALAQLSTGVCVARVDTLNDQCGDLPGTRATWVSRYLGASGAADASAQVCVP